MRGRILGTAMLLAAGAAGCVASGAIKGRLKQPGQAPAPVTLTYRSARFGENGTMQATLPDGETFKGRYLQVGSETEGEALAPFWGGWDVGWSDWGTSNDSDYAYGVAGGIVPEFTQRYSGRVIANMLGNKGDRMRCRFRLANPAEGMSSGGVGECQVTGGAKIEAEF